jgi:hypothetical protein
LVPKNGTPDGVTGVKGLNCHFARPTTMSATNGAMMTTENSVEPVSANAVYVAGNTQTDTSDSYDAVLVKYDAPALGYCVTTYCST